MSADSNTAFMDLYQGYLAGVMRWDDLSNLWQRIKQQSSGWYVYAVGEKVPEEPAPASQLTEFVDSIDDLLRREHDQDYCGIVYVDDTEQPQLVKIYDPNNLGVVCGFSDNPPLPGWILSRVAPDDLPSAFPPVESRKRWWRKLFG